MKTFLLSFLMMHAAFATILHAAEPAATSQPIENAKTQDTASQDSNTVTQKDLLTVQPYDRILGNENALVTIIEYSSLSCPHCATFHNDVFPVLNEKYIEQGKVRLIARNFPTNEPALRASMLTMCVDEARYYPFLKVLFRMQPKWAMSMDFKESLKTLAKVGGVSEEAFEACLADESVEQQVLDIRRSGGDALAIEATPTFFINGEKLQGAGTVERFEEIIDKHLAKE